MRTQEEILNRIKEVDREDIFGHQREIFVNFLNFENAKQFLTSEGIEKGKAYWNTTIRVPNTALHIISDMGEYIGFAWEKALDERGLSASRSISKMQAYLWLLENNKLLKFANDEDNYPQYGKPILLEISKKYGFVIPTEVVQELGKT